MLRLRWPFVWTRDIGRIGRWAYWPALNCLRGVSMSAPSVDSQKDTKAQRHKVHTNKEAVLLLPDLAYIQISHSVTPVDQAYLPTAAVPKTERRFQHSDSNANRQPSQPDLRGRVHHPRLGSVGRFRRRPESERFFAWQRRRSRRYWFYRRCSRMQSGGK